MARPGDRRRGCVPARRQQDDCGLPRGLPQPARHPGAHRPQLASGGRGPPLGADQDRAPRPAHPSRGLRRRRPPVRAAARRCAGAARAGRVTRGRAQLRAPAHPARGGAARPAPRRRAREPRRAQARRPRCSGGRIGAGGGAPARLDVYGDGPGRVALQALVDELGLADAVRLLGFRPDALDAFQTASFFLLTSSTEGFPLVLAEGMSRGSLPLSYDIPYGPADVITDGVSGFLVPPGDVVALGERIRDLVEHPDRAASLRRAAATAAARFSEEAVLRRWAEVLHRARARRGRPAPAFDLTVRSGEVSHTAAALTAVADFAIRGADVRPAEVTAAIALHGPEDAGSCVELRAAATVRRTLRHGIWRARAEFPAGAARWLTAGTPVTGELELRIDGAVRRALLEP
nr:glycosyltransferase [Naasia aerilata]